VSRAALVVDDSVSMRQMVAFTLREAGFTVLEGGNGREAIEALGNRPVQLVVTDLNMPVMDGLELIRQLRAKPLYKFTPILMLTTESQDAKKQEGRAAGATGWIVKPFDPQKLLAVIAKVVG
jgi:two-component system chemotaxis response regulator CheY